MPENIKMGTALDQNIYDISYLDTKYPEEFNEAVGIVEEELKQSQEIQVSILKKLTMKKSKRTIKEEEQDTEEEKKEWFKLPPIQTNKNKFESELDESDRSEENDGGEGEDSYTSNQDSHSHLANDQKGELLFEGEQEKEHDNKISNNYFEEESKSEKDNLDHIQEDLQMISNMNATNDNIKLLREEDKKNENEEEDKISDNEEETKEEEVNEIKKESPKESYNASDGAKLDALTMAPRDEEEHEGVQEQDINTLELPKPEEPQAESPVQKFDKMPKTYQQRVVNMVMDKVMEKSTTYYYQGFHEDLKPKGYLLPEDKALKTENSSYHSYYSEYWYIRKTYKGLEYQPKVLREKLQISIWKVDKFGVVKIRDRYFTPKTKRC